MTPNFAGLVDIGDGRWLYLDCQGSGSPTVFIIPGKGSYAEVWNVVVPADDPIRSSPYDIIGAGQPPAEPDGHPTDRREDDPRLRLRPAQHPPGRTDRSTPVPQPHSSSRMSMTW